jgi:hypothetical protein
VATIISWWIDQETGYPIPERDGVIRYFIKNGQNYIWGDTIDEVKEKSWHFLEEMIKASGLVPENFIKSITFISGSVYDNKKLLEKDPNYISNLLSQDEDEQSRLLKGNWKHIPNDKDIYDYESFNAMFHSNVNCRTGKKRITADIALEGSNMFIVGVFDGRELIDIEIVEKSKGNEVIDKIKSLCRKHSIPNNQVYYDADGVGGFVDGFIQGAKPFHGGTSPKEIKDSVSGKIIKENYMNLKTQCYYRSGSAVSNGEYSVASEVANKSYMGKMTVMERMKIERRAIKKDKTDHDGKLRILPKQEMKVILNGDSPDILDMFMMNEFALMAPSFEWYVITE